jgi:hypothetical protein
MIVRTFNGGNWDGMPWILYTNKVVYWMEPAFFFLDAIVLTIALIRIHNTFKNDTQLAMSE